MTRMRWLGIGALVGAAVAAVAAVSVGFAVAQDSLDKVVGIPLAIALAVGAEVLMWTGGALLGLSFLTKRGGWVARLLGRRKAPAGDAS